jgi:hypothetical protein
MMVWIHKGFKVTDPDFSGKVSFWQKWPKMVKYSLKTGFWDFFLKIVSLLLAGNGLK